jgi:Plasma-membrane choline transporter
MPRNQDDKLVAPPDFDGPTKNRHCTDVLCFLLLVVSWVAMTAVGYYAVMNGDLRLVLNPLDYDGNVCGTDFAANMTDYPKLLYVNHQTGGVCVKECPNLENVTADNLTDVRTLITYDGIFQLDGAELPKDAIQVGNYSNANASLSCTSNTCFPNDSVELSWVSPGIRKGFGYAYYATSTFELLSRCYTTKAAERRLAELVEPEAITTGNGTIPTTAVDKNVVQDTFDFTTRLFADVYLARKYVFGFGFGLSMGVSIVYLFLMRLPGLLTAVVWASILSTITICLGGGYYAWTKAAEWRETDYVGNRGANLTTAFSVFLFALGAILIILTCTLRRSIMVAITCCQEAGKAVNQMVIILLVPVLQSIGLLVFLVPFVYYAAHLASLGHITTKDIDAGPDIAALNLDAPQISIRVYEFDDKTEYLGWYLLFCFFWTSNFIVAMGDVSADGCQHERKTNFSVALR